MFQCIGNWTVEVSVPEDSSTALEGQLLVDIPSKGPFIVEPPKQTESASVSSAKETENDVTNDQGTEKRSVEGDDKQTSEKPDAEDAESENDGISSLVSSDELQREQRREQLAEYLKQETPIVRLTGKIVEEPRSVKFSHFITSPYVLFIIRKNIYERCEVPEKL